MPPKPSEVAPLTALSAIVVSDEHGAVWGLVTGTPFTATFPDWHPIATVSAGAVLLMPAAPQAAFAQGGDAPANQADFCSLANIAGLPALSLPAGRDADGMPVAVQLVGAPGSEALLFAAARRLDDRLRAYAPPPIE